MAIPPLKIEKFEERVHGQLISRLTQLLHLAYGELARQGMRYTASYQNEQETLRRLKKGEGYLGFLDGKCVATISLYSTDPESLCRFYQRPGVDHFGQFAVQPNLQGLGYGKQLLDWVESLSKKRNARELALDTAETADRLIATYQRRGYRPVDHVQWQTTNYRSVILSKTL